MDLKRVDKKLYQDILQTAATSFVRLWVSGRDFKKHLKKRLKKGQIKSEEEYFKVFKEAFLNPKIVCKEKDDIVYFGKNGWVVVIDKEGKIVTVFPKMGSFRIKRGCIPLALNR